MLEIKVDDEIILRSVEPGDAEDLFTLTEASRHYLREWLPWVAATQSVEDTLGFIEYSQRQQLKDDGFQCAIWHKEKLVGMVGLTHVDKSNRKTEIGYWLGQDFQGDGIMTRTCHRLIDYLFDELDLHRVTIRVAVGNERSRAIPERLGFLEEGIVREAEWLYDHFEDSVVYGLLRSDRSERGAS